jgi:hypothetical protein
MTAGWLALEDGVEVQFSDASFLERRLLDDPGQDRRRASWSGRHSRSPTSPRAAAAARIRHHFCRLALIAFDAASNQWSVVEDCRPIFPPLTECCGQSATAIHVVDTNWANDDVIPHHDLREGRPGSGSTPCPTH